MNKKNIITPIHPLNYGDGKNEFYIKRDDLLPFSFGGNKVRIAQQYFKDMRKKNCDCIVAYGSSKSNLSRVIANMSKAFGISCVVISSSDDSSDQVETNNSKIVSELGVEVVYCNKNNVSQTVKDVIDACKEKGFNPYYIYGDIYGRGNEKVAVQAYVETYAEIKKYEERNDLEFDYIFHASGTGTTQSGLICGNLSYNDTKSIVGISVARNMEQNKKIIKNNIIQYIGMRNADEIDNTIYFEDKYLAGGYGKFNDKIIKMIKAILCNDGIPLDTTYTGKAFWGMTEYLIENSIKGKKILFIHTGGLPLFFDNLN